MKVEKHLKQKYQTEASAQKSDEAMMAYIDAEWKKQKKKVRGRLWKFYLSKINKYGNQIKSVRFLNFQFSIYYHTWFSHLYTVFCNKNIDEIYL